MAEVLQFPPFVQTPVTPPETGEIQAVEIPDQTARDQALDTRASWIVEAPAGSGKTGLLMQRFLKLLADPGTAHPEEVLAITFTRKATAELRTRVLEQLEAAEANAPLRQPASPFDQATRRFAQAVLARDAQLHWGLLEEPGKLRIRTIDSLCAEIANTLPLLSGSGAGRNPVEEADALYRLAARRTLMELGGTDVQLHRALHTVLLHRDGSLADCESLLARMLQNREQWAELVPLDRESLNDDTLETVVRPRLEQALESIVCAGLTRAVRALPQGALQELTTLAHRLGIEPGYKGEESPIAFCSSLHLSPEARADHLDHWLALIHLLLTSDGSWRKGFAVNHLRFSLPKAKKPTLEMLINGLSSEDVREALCAVRDLPPARYPDDQWDVAKALFRLLLHALAELKVLFAERGESDFAELAHAAREALESETGAADLASSASSTLRHLLVDEMQDTSSAQYHLLQLLTRSWDGSSQTLFLVGDPKQSIYLFRQARVERFLRSIREGRLGDVPLRSIRLTANFRSQPELVMGFNKDFSQIFPSLDQATSASREGGDVPFVAASPVRSMTDSEGTVWHTAVLDKPQPGDPSDGPRRDRTLSEAHQIRTVVESWRSKPLPPGRSEPWRIAVLARARRHLAPVVAEFQSSDVGSAPIPFRAVKVEALNERQEVLDVLALTRALLHPADRIAWLAVLHGPWCGLGLADLLAITGEGAHIPSTAARAHTIPALVASRAHLLSPDGQALLHRAWPILQKAQEQTGRGELATLVERTWRSLGGDVLLQPEQITNVQRYFSLLREMQDSGPLDLRSLSAQLTRLYAQPAAIDDAVDLMTIHTAKGLEWDVVLVPALEKRGQSSRSELLNWLELDATGSDEASIVLAPIQRKGEKSTDLYKWINSIHKKREAAENKRLLYVACTRAREALHLFAACERDDRGELKAPYGTLLESFWPVAQQHFDATPIANNQHLVSSPAPSLDDQHLDEPETLALAAAADPHPKHETPLLYRLPLHYSPVQRFVDAAHRRLSYPKAQAVPGEPAFERPEGSFAVRAFGNVVHRFLQLLATRMASGISAEMLLSELPGWQPRLLTSLRGEGLAPAQAAREAARALSYLMTTLTDPAGRWILSPKPHADTEATLTLADALQTSTMRVDRTFEAGAEPLSVIGDTTWIIDFKTTEQGSRSAERFAQEEREKYVPQLARYADLLRATGRSDKPIMLGLYYSSIPRLIHWPA